jgi:hypothetical protein
VAPLPITRGGNHSRYPSAGESTTTFEPLQGSSSHKQKGKRHQVVSITPRIPFRQLPEPYTHPDSPPSSPAVVSLCHPANGLAFLALPAYDLFCQSPLQFGIHHETLVTACCIIAYNKPGYLSTSRNRGAALDSIIPAAGEYYYHLNDPSDRFYSICCNFNTWKFSHGHLPPSWVAKSPCAPSFSY